MEIRRKTLWWTLGLIILALLVFVGIRMYEKGYRLGLPTGIVAPGMLEIAPYEESQQMYLDANETPLMGIPPGTRTLRIPLPAGTHEVLISRNGYHPWQKSFEMGSKETIYLAPFAVPSATNGVVLPKSDQEYKPALAAIASTTVPTQENPLLSHDEAMSVYLKDGALIAKVPEGKTPPQYFCNAECKEEHTVLTIEAEVRGVSFFPGRNDVLLVAVGNSIYALELDTRGTQNFEPVYQGIHPSFGIGPGYLYAHDGESVFIVSLSPSR